MMRTTYLNSEFEAGKSTALISGSHELVGYEDFEIIK
jgi:hypothetical protein